MKRSIFLSLFLCWMVFSWRVQFSVSEEQIRSVEPQQSQPHKRETSSEWKYLFDGKNTLCWREFRGKTFPDSWRVENQTLTCLGKKRQLISKEQFEDFELRLEWKLSSKGNSGIFFRVSEEHERPAATGPEFQLLDNQSYPKFKNSSASCGANFGLHAPLKDLSKPVGQWNQLRLICQGSHVEHWLNGVKVLDYELGSKDWNERVQTSKFARYATYGKKPKGHLLLQDHGDRVWFRHIKIRTFKPENSR